MWSQVTERIKIWLRPSPEHSKCNSCILNVCYKLYSLNELTICKTKNLYLRLSQLLSSIIFYRTRKIDFITIRKDLTIVYKISLTNWWMNYIGDYVKVFPCHGLLRHLRNRLSDPFFLRLGLLPFGHYLFQFHYR